MVCAIHASRAPAGAYLAIALAAMGVIGLSLMQNRSPWQMATLFCGGLFIAGSILAIDVIRDAYHPGGPGEMGFPIPPWIVASVTMVPASAPLLGVCLKGPRRKE